MVNTNYHNPSPIFIDVYWVYKWKWLYSLILTVCVTCGKDERATGIEVAATAAAVEGSGVGLNRNTASGIALIRNMIGCCRMSLAASNVLSKPIGVFLLISGLGWHGTEWEWRDADLLLTYCCGDAEVRTPAAMAPLQFVLSSAWWRASLTFIFSSSQSLLIVSSHLFFGLPLLRWSWTRPFGYLLPRILETWPK